MAETFTLDELNSSVEPKSYSLDELNNHSFSLDDLNAELVSKSPEPNTDSSIVNQIFDPNKILPASNPGFQIAQKAVEAVSPKTAAYIKSDEPVLPLGDLIFQQGGINPGFQIAKQAIGAIGPKTAALEKGTEEATRETLNGLATPKNIALMLGSMGIASTGAAAARLVSALWSGFMGAHAVEDAPDIVDTIKTELDKPEDKRDYSVIAKEVSKFGINASMAVLPGIHAFSGIRGGGTEVPEKFPTEDRGAVLAKMANDYEAARAAEAGSPFVRNTPAQEPITMGIEQGKLPALGAEGTFEPSGLKLVQEQAQKILDDTPAIEKDIAPETKPEPEAPPITEPEPAKEGGVIGVVAGTDLEKWADDVLKSGGTHGGTDVLAAYLVKGVAVLERGVTDFAKWSAEIVKDLGADAVSAIKPHLKRLYNESVNLRAQQFSKSQTAPPTAAPSPALPTAQAAPLRLASAIPPSIPPLPPNSIFAGARPITPPPLPPATLPGGPPPLPNTVAPAASSRLSVAPSDIRERFRPIERQDSPAVARGFVENVQSGPRARTIVNDFLRTAFGRNAAERERLATDFVRLGWDNRRIELQGRGLPAAAIPALTPQEAARIRAEPGIQAAVQLWNREIAPMITDIRTRNNMIMSPNWGNADLMLNLPGEYDPAAQSRNGVNTADPYNRAATGENALQNDPVEALNQIIRGHLRYDATQRLAESIRRDVSIPPNTVVDPRQRANPVAFPAPRQGEHFEAPYRGRTIEVEAIDLDPEVGDLHYVPLRVAEAWKHQFQDRSVYNNLWDRIRGIAISYGILPVSFLPHVYRETTAVAARIAQSGQNPLSMLPSWLGSNEYALYRMNQMRETRYGQLMQRLVDRTGSDRGAGFVDEPNRLMRALNARGIPTPTPHELLFNPDYGIDVMARRTIADAALIKRFGVREMRAMEAAVNDGTMTVQQAMRTLETRLNDADMLSVGREVNNTMGWGNTQTRTTSLNWLQRVLPFVSSESGKIPDEIRRFTTLNVDIPTMSRAIRRGDYQQAAQSMASSLANGAIGIYLLSSLANFAVTRALTGKGQSLSDNPEGRRTDIQIARGWWLGNLDPGLSRAARILGAKDLANSKGKEAPDVGRELVNEALSVLDPTLRWLFVAGTLLGGKGKNLYLTQSHELSDARKSDMIPFAPARNILNAIGSKKPMDAAMKKDVAQFAGVQLLDQPPKPEAIKGAKRNAAVDMIAREAKQLPKMQRRDFVRKELQKRGMSDDKARARIGRMYPGLYKYED